jgi:hypothetical protein
MTEQSEALRLAEWIESDMSCDGDEKIVAELRRQHDENQRLRLIVPQVLEDLNDKLCEDNERLIAQRDQLLKVLKKARAEFDGLPRSIGYDFTHLPEIDAAIKAVEENT